MDEPHTGRNAALALVGVVAVAGLVVLAISLNGRRHDHATTITDSGALITDAGATSSTDAGTVSSLDTGGSSTPTGAAPAADASTSVTPQDMAQVLQAYVAAYSSQDIDALGALFADTLTRFDGRQTEDLAQALRTYQSQFDQFSNPQYHLTGVQFQPGDGQGFATGQYAITGDSGGLGSGRIAFTFTVVDGRLLIDHISITPS